MEEAKDVTLVGGWFAPASAVSSASLDETYRIQVTCNDDIVYLLRCARALCLGHQRDVRRAIQGSTAVVVEP